MRIVIQRVRHASVTVDGAVVGAIGQGLMVLVGIAEGDTRDDVQWLAAKTVAMRIFNDDRGVMNLSVADIPDARVLAVSQFTLHASTRRGNRPSYVRAARPEVAKPLYDDYCSMIQDLLGRKVECGVFGADMAVEMLNDGPVTIIVDSKLRE